MVKSGIITFGFKKSRQDNELKVKVTKQLKACSGSSSQASELDSYLLLGCEESGATSGMSAILPESTLILLPLLMVGHKLETWRPIPWLLLSREPLLTA